MASAAHYHVLDVKVGGAPSLDDALPIFSNVVANHTIEATFEQTTHTIAAGAGAHGSITPSGAVSVNDGDAQGFTIAAATHYQILDGKVARESVGAAAGYSFSNDIADQTI